MSRKWDFLGELKENDKRVITSGQGTITETEGDPSIEVTADGGVLNIDLELPISATVSPDDLVGEKWADEDGNIKDSNAVPYGEIFNDYADNVASGNYSHVTGRGNQAESDFQTVFGKYNNNNADNALEVGWGTAENRKNIFEIKTNGDVSVKGSLSAEGDLVAAGEISDSSGLSFTTLDEIKLDKSEFTTYLAESQAIILSDTNDTELTVKGPDEITVVDIDFVTTDATKPIFIATIPFVLSNDGNVTFKYYLNDSLITTDTVSQYCSKGENFATLANIFDIRKEFTGNLKVTMTTSYVESDARRQEAEILSMKNYILTLTYAQPVVDTTVPTATVKAYGIKSVLYVQGIGLSLAWNGRLVFTDSFDYAPLKQLPKVELIPFSVEIHKDMPVIYFGEIRWILPNTDDYNYETQFFITDTVANLLSFKTLYSAAEYPDYTGYEKVACDEGVIEVMDIRTDFILYDEWGEKSGVLEHVEYLKSNQRWNDPDNDFAIVFNLSNKDNYIYDSRYIDDNIDFRINKIYSNHGEDVIIDHGICVEVSRDVTEYKVLKDVEWNLFNKKVFDSTLTVVFTIDNKENYEYDSFYIIDDTNFKLESIFEYENGDAQEQTYDEGVIRYVDIPAYEIPIIENYKMEVSSP